MGARRVRPPGKAPQPEAAPPGVFGYFPKAEAARLLALLGGAGIPGTLGRDREVARQIKESIGINPIIRRRSSYRDVPSGCFVEVADADVPRALERLAGTAFDPSRVDAPEGDETDEPVFFSDPRWCPACALEAPPHAEACPACGDSTVDILRRGRAGEQSRRPWAALLIGAILLALALSRLLR